VLPPVRTYTVKEVAAMTALSRQTVTRLFEHEHVVKRLTVK
jgi:hypothetical protein